MIGNCCNDSDSRYKVVVVVGALPVLLAAGAVYGLLKLVWGVGQNLAMPSAGWIPLLMPAAAVTLWGLWLGFTVHGRGEPLSVGLFGRFVMTFGFFFFTPFVLLGVLIVLAAAVWSATACVACGGSIGAGTVETACACDPCS
jgi:hypothetical protein